MDNLTPITREEMLMNDEPLTPITREEKILAGEDLTPVTRREYFLKKYRHAGGDVMVEGLSVTANGTYTAPEGKAYSPVEVAVPLPDNAYLLKTASGSLVSFSDGADLPMPSFICKIEAVQSGSGDPSPENVRPISGHTGVDAVISPTTEASAGTTYSVSWQTEAGKVFGGYVDLVSGVLTVDRVSVVYEGGNDEAWTMSTGGSDDTSWHQFYTPRTSAKNSLNAICNRFPTKDIAYRGTESLLVAYTDRTFRIALKDSDLLITSVDDWKTWLSTNNVQIVYELATPITYQLTPQQIKSLLGYNNAWCDTGDVDIDYFAKEVTG